jgi:uncharacterized membrane protein
VNNAFSKENIIPIKKFYDLLLVVCYIFLSVAFILLPPLNETPLRVILGLPLVLFVPGYVFISALFPEKKEFDSLERIALSIGLSICIAIFTGFLLTYTPFGVRQSSVLFSLSTITLLMTAISGVRRITVPDWEKPCDERYPQH